MNLTIYLHRQLTQISDENEIIVFYASFGSFQAVFLKASLLSVHGLVHRCICSGNWSQHYLPWRHRGVYTSCYYRIVRQRTIISASWEDPGGTHLQTELRDAPCVGDPWSVDQAGKKTAHNPPKHFKRLHIVVDTLVFYRLQYGDSHTNWHIYLPSLEESNAFVGIKRVPSVLPGTHHWEAHFIQQCNTLWVCTFIYILQ